jgi:hypothetical protein
MAFDLGKSIALGLFPGLVIGVGFYVLAKISQGLQNKKQEKWLEKNKGLPPEALEIAALKRNATSNKRDFIIWLVVIGVVVVFFWGLTAISKV